jgi:hypothetical protein
MVEKTMNAWGSMVGQLATLPVQGEPAVDRFNPRPAGVIRQGSASEAVLQTLRAARGQFLTHAQIKARTGRTQKALSWALIFLHDQQLIQRAPDESRNGRYFRYGVVLPR